MESDPQGIKLNDVHGACLKSDKTMKKSACIVVLGDIGHSPRMQYHAYSLIEEGFYVNMIGYGGSKIPEELNNPNIWFSFLQDDPGFLRNIPRLLAYPLKVAWQVFFLSWAFTWMLVGKQFYPEYILVQNPPAVPTLLVCWLYARVLGSKFVIDWHNYGFSIMSLAHGEQNKIVKLYKWFENYFGAKGDYHFCVTESMKNDLKKRLNIEAVTLYDKPPVKFQSLSHREKQDCIDKFSLKYPILKEENVGVLISSTSWTEDEDFSILLSALQNYDNEKEENPKLYRKLVVFITGKGPLKEFYQRKIMDLNVRNVEIHLPWLEPEDYPKLIACADLGVSLHTSSSGLDLPMKVVDMFGCGVPVCAMNFKCVSELVKHGENGQIFKNSEELAAQIKDWFKNSKSSSLKHDKYRECLKSFQSCRWKENWKLNAGPIFNNVHK